MNNEILDKLEWDADAGRLSYNDVRYLLIRPETLIDFQKAAEDELANRVDEMLYAGGFTGGSLSSRRYKEVFGYSDEEIVDFMCSMGGQIGWGHFEMIELDTQAGRLVVDVHGSPFAEAYGEADAGVCHFIRGVLGGLGAGIFDADVDAQETQCIAAGADRCRFQVERTDSDRLAES